MDRHRQWKKENGYCLDCDEKAVVGKTRCYRCLQIIAVKQKIRYKEQSKDPAYIEKRREYQKKWQEKNPEKMAVYKSRKPMYNRRYFYGGGEE